MGRKAVTFSIPEEQHAFVQGQIAAGNFADETEVVAAGLAVLMREAKVRELRTLIAEGDADIAAGRVYEYETTEDFFKDIAREELAD
jgi:antitoxin ParD1/3/4